MSGIEFGVVSPIQKWSDFAKVHASNFPKKWSQTPITLRKTPNRRKQALHQKTPIQLIIASHQNRQIPKILQKQLQKELQAHKEQAQAQDFRLEKAKHDA